MTKKDVLSFWLETGKEAFTTAEASFKLKLTEQ